MQNRIVYAQFASLVLEFNKSDINLLSAFLQPSCEVETENMNIENSTQIIFSPVKFTRSTIDIPVYFAHLVDTLTTQQHQWLSA